MEQYINIHMIPRLPRIQVHPHIGNKTMSSGIKVQMKRNMDIKGGSKVNRNRKVLGMIFTTKIESNGMNYTHLEF